MLKRRRFRQTESLQERLAAFAKDALNQASTLPDGIERDELLEKARRADVAAHIDEWANSSGLQAPK